MLDAGGRKRQKCLMCQSLLSPLAHLLVMLTVGEVVHDCSKGGHYS